MSDVRLNVFWRLLQSFLLGPVAQLVEQRIENPRVVGSIPTQATKQNPSSSNVARVFCFVRACVLHDSCGLSGQIELR